MWKGKACKPAIYMSAVVDSDDKRIFLDAGSSSIQAHIAFLIGCNVLCCVLDI